MSSIQINSNIVEIDGIISYKIDPLLQTYTNKLKDASDREAYIKSSIEDATDINTFTDISKAASSIEAGMNTMDFDISSAQNDLNKVKGDLNDIHSQAAKLKNDCDYYSK